MSEEVARVSGAVSIFWEEHVSRPEFWPVQMARRMANGKEPMNMRMRRARDHTWSSRRIAVAAGHHSSDKKFNGRLMSDGPFGRKNLQLLRCIPVNLKCSCLRGLRWTNNFKLLLGAKVDFVLVKLLPKVLQLTDTHLHVHKEDTKAHTCHRP